MKIIRVLEYEGDSEKLRKHLWNRGVKGHNPSFWSRAVMTIKERFVLPDPLPEWWDEVVPGVEEEDPTTVESNLISCHTCGYKMAIDDVQCHLDGKTYCEGCVPRKERG